MQKIELPIKKDKNDKISPLKPDFKWLFKMIFWSVLSIFIIFISIILFSRFFVERISIEKEKEIFGSFIFSDKKNIFDKSILSSDLGELNDYEIYIMDSEIPNAFASLGANITITSGLLKEAETKEEIIFILGHELAHIKNRDVISNLSKSAPISLGLNFLGLDFGFGELRVSNLTGNFYSREAELKADTGGIELINKLGLNGVCAIGFFERIGGNENKYLEFLKSHPINPKRIDFIKENSLHKDKECSKFKYKEKNN